MCDMSRQVTADPFSWKGGSVLWALWPAILLRLVYMYCAMYGVSSSNFFNLEIFPYHFWSYQFLKLS